MIPSTFAYDRAESVAEAIEKLQSAGGDGKLLAGGHSLLPLMKLRLTSPAKLIDIGRIAELHGIAQVGDAIAIGALTTHAAVASSTLVKEKLPVLAQAASQIGDIQVRNRGTVGGNLAHADMASDLPAVALALDAEFAVATPDGNEVIGVEDFFIGPMVTALPEYSMVTNVKFKLPPAGAMQVYEKVPHPASGYAVVGVAAVVAVAADQTVNYVRVGMTGAADVAYRAKAVEDALMGHAFTEAAIDEAAKFAAVDGSIAGDLYASEEYRRNLCVVHTARALKRLLNA